MRAGRATDMLEAGLLDVAAAQKAAVQHAVAGAAIGLTVDILIHKKKPQETPGRP